MKKHSLVCMTAALCLILTACGGSLGGTSQNKEETGSEKESTESAESKTEEKEEKAVSLEDLPVYKVWYTDIDIKTMHYIYDQAGRLLTEETMFYPETEPYMTKNYHYDAAGNLTSWDDVTGSHAEFSADGKCRYVYYSNGSSREYNEQGLLIYEYDSKYLLHTLYTYDEQGRILTEESHSGEEEDKEGQAESRIEYTYSDDGLSVTTQLYDGDGNRWETHTGYYDFLEYDSAGNLLHKYHASQSGENDSEEFHEYDTEGNETVFIKKNINSGNETVMEERYRTYENGTLLLDERYMLESKVVTTNELDDMGRLIKSSVLHTNIHTGEVLFDYVKELREYDERGNLSRVYTFAEPNDDEYEDYVQGGYEIEGLDGAEEVTVYIYSYDGDPYSKLYPENTEE